MDLQPVRRPLSGYWSTGRWLAHTHSPRRLVDSISEEAAAALSTSAVDHGSAGTAQANSASMASVSVTALLKRRMSPDEQSDPPSSFFWIAAHPPIRRREQRAPLRCRCCLWGPSTRTPGKDGSSGSTRRAKVRTRRTRQKASPSGASPLQTTM
jgi:hypothetical protein